MFAFILGLVPGLTKLVTSYLVARQNAQVEMYIAKTGATKDVAVAAIQASASVTNRWWFVALLIPLWAIPFIIYDWKIVLYDVLWSNGTTTTDPLRGTLDWVHITIVASLFVHGIVTTVTGSIKS